jgi:hypothetical protein
MWQASSMAAPNKFKKSFCDQAAVLTKLGATDAELADFFKVSLRTLHRWKALHADFANALRLGKHEADERVTRSLFQRAVGYTAPETHIAVHQGKAIATELIKHYPPDTTACIFWLKNRRPEEWREKFEHDHGLNLSREKLAQLLRAVEGRLVELEDPAPGDAGVGRLS